MGSSPLVAANQSNIFAQGVGEQPAEIRAFEDHALAGGFGSAVLEALQDAECPTAVERIGWPDKFVEHGSSNGVLRASYGLAPNDIHRQVLARWRNLSAEPAHADL